MLWCCPASHTKMCYCSRCKPRHLQHPTAYSSMAGHDIYTCVSWCIYLHAYDINNMMAGQETPVWDQQHDGSPKICLYHYFYPFSSLIALATWWLCIQTSLCRTNQSLARPHINCDIRRSPSLWSAKCQLHANVNSLDVTRPTNIYRVWPTRIQQYGTCEIALVKVHSCRQQFMNSNRMYCNMQYIKSVVKRTGDQGCSWPLDPSKHSSEHAEI